MMTLYGRTTSYNVQKVLWLLDELQLEFEHIECGGRHDSLDTAAFRAINPFAKVPVLIDRDQPVRESNTILRYLSARYGGESWWPHDAYLRSRFEAWMDWSIDILEQAFVGVFWGYYRMPESRRDWAHINKSKDKCLYCLGMIETQLEHSPWLAGEALSLADISVGVFMYRLTTIDLAMTPAENTRRWYRALCHRPGYRQYVMSDYSELKGRQDY